MFSFFVSLHLTIWWVCWYDLKITFASYLSILVDILKTISIASRVHVYWWFLFPFHSIDILMTGKISHEINWFKSEFNSKQHHQTKYRSDFDESKAKRWWNWCAKKRDIQALSLNDWQHRTRSKFCRVQSLVMKCEDKRKRREEKKTPFEIEHFQLLHRIFLSLDFIIRSIRTPSFCHS